MYVRGGSRIHLIILFSAGINLMDRTGCLYQPFIVASKTIIKPSVSLMSSASGSKVKDI